MRWHVARHTGVRLPPRLAHRAPPKGTQRYPRGSPLSAHVRGSSLVRFLNSLLIPKSTQPTESPSMSSCYASASPSAPAYPGLLPLLRQRRASPRPPNRSHRLSRRRRRLLTSAVSPSARCGLSAAIYSKPPSSPLPTIQKPFIKSPSSTPPPSSPPSGVGSRCAALFSSDNARSHIPSCPAILAGVPLGLVR